MNVATASDRVQILTPSTSLWTGAFVPGRGLAKHNVLCRMIVSALRAFGRNGLELFLCLCALEPRTRIRWGVRRRHRALAPSSLWTCREI